MSPNITSEPVLFFASRQTVAGRKEALELRKTMKPLIEKKRRARVNYSLDHLKTLIFPLTGKDNSRCSKLEKADILEMTVNFLSDIPAAKTNGSEDRYTEGYKACLHRVSDLLPKTSLDQATCQRIDDFIQRSMPVNVTPACQNCCAQSIRALPQIQQRLLSLKSHLSPRSVSQNSSVITTLPNPAQDAAQATDASMWRPW